MIHETADVQTTTIGESSSVWQYSVILKGASIGEHCNVNCHCFIENDVVLGDYVTVKSGNYLWDGLRIANRVFIGPNVTFTNDVRPRSKQYPDHFDQTIIEEGASIGAASTILGGIKIGKYAMIGAGSLATKNIEPYSLWYGSPARFKCYICSCGEKLTQELTCPKCTKTYKKNNNIIMEVSS